jgi:hypothetical protein
MTDRGTRRDFVKKAAYVTPVVLTMTVKPAHARSGSAGPERGDHCRGRGRQDGDRGHRGKNGDSHGGGSRGQGFFGRLLGMLND